MGIDIHEVIDAAKTKPFGFQAFYPGPGLGGHCIPIDPFYLSWKAKEFDFQTRFIELAGEVNISMPYFVIDQLAAGLNEQCKSIKGSKVLVLGLAYKRDIDDLRESPSLTIIELLRDKGALVAYNDPFFPTVGHGRHYDLNMTNTPLDNLGPVRRRGDRDRPLRLRLQGHCGAVTTGDRHQKCDQGHCLAQNCALLESNALRVGNAADVWFPALAVFPSQGRRARIGPSSAPEDGSRVHRVLWVGSPMILLLPTLAEPPHFSLWEKSILVALVLVSAAAF